jgi:1-acyl-sn-glycerol-3-phosphate acyltransferase
LTKIVNIKCANYYGDIEKPYVRRPIAFLGVFILANFLLGSFFIWIPLCIVVDLVRRKWRLPIVRLIAFLLCWAWLETAGVVASIAFWAAGQKRKVSLHYTLQRWWAGGLILALRATVGLRIEVKNPEVLVPGPLVVLSRHASLADSLVSAWAMGNIAGLHPRYVLKRELMLDPCLDIVGHRLPNYFLNRTSNNVQEELAGVAALSKDLGHSDVSVIFPEGTRANASKRQRLLEKLTERNPERAQLLAPLTMLLPPKPAGAIALMQGAPQCDVVIAGHVGFDGLDTFGGMLRHLEQGNVKCVMWFRRIARPDIPTESMAAWLDQQWLLLDTEVQVQSEALKGVK